MTVLVFIGNNNGAAGAYCATHAKAQYPGCSVGYRNPKFYRKEEHEAADAVYVESGQDATIGAYEAEDTPVNQYAIIDGFVKIGIDDGPVYTNRYDAQVERLTALPVTQIRNALSRISDKDLLRVAKQAEETGKNRKMAIDAYDDAISDLR